jgi:hypothetical protein
MKRKSIIWLVSCAISAVVGVTALLVVTGRHQPEKVQSPAPLAAHPEPSSPPAAVEQAMVTPFPAPESASAVPTTPRRENVVPETGGAPQKVVRVKPESILATVKGIPITLKDMIPLPKEKSGTEQMISAEMYDFLFNRAIERELTFQAARAQGVELSQEQKDRLAEIRAQSERHDPAVFDPVQHNNASSEFEQRDFEGLALQANLAQKASVPSSFVTSEQVEAYFLQHRNDYSQIPEDPAQRSAASWAAVDTEIRAKLTPALQAEHDRQLSKMLEGWKAQANIVVAAQEQ